MTEAKRLRETGWSDLELQGIQWLAGGRDVQFVFRAPTLKGSKQIIRFFTCSWAAGLRLALSFEKNEGRYPLTWDVRLEEVESGWHIHVDLAGHGSIELVCSELEIDEHVE